VLLADKVALLDTVDGVGTITHIGTHEELLATVPRYRYLLAADDELDDGTEPRPEWEDEADRQQLDHVYEEAVGQQAATRRPIGYIATERTR
jgi:ATP-binding cassette subfamily B protein